MTEIKNSDYLLQKPTQIKKNQTIKYSN